MIGPCAKQRVQAIVRMRNTMRIFVGENVGTNPQPQCPRVPGEAYGKCFSICGTLGHAEETALRQVRMAGYLPSDIEAIDVYNHTGPCDHCRALLRDLGLEGVTTFHPGVMPEPLMLREERDIAMAYNLDAPSSHSKHADDARVTRQRNIGNEAHSAKGE